ncbi:aminoglycoside N(3)-acetyltransferase [Deinococcus sp.]|uniref:aminoglycoside N(3)-acetyltransferase n=1 Tax=Deinococcus sp. TaxID=47478 RepID=UPI003C7DD0A3
MAGETGSIGSADAPRTRRSLLGDLEALGVQPGMTLMVHASMKSLGWVAGGSVAVVLALLDAVGPEGTLAMPAFTGDLTEPSYWQRPPVPESWWPMIRAETPAFDPALTPTRMMGRVAESFRSWPGTLRSDHPHSSVCARGPLARTLTDRHRLEDSMGEHSPFARLYDAGAFVLQLGTDRNSSLHLAEHRSGMRGRVTQGAPILEDGERVWKVFEDLAYDDDSFPPVKAAFEASGAVRVGQVGSAVARLMPVRGLVDFAAEWFREGKE